MSACHSSQNECDDLLLAIFGSGRISSSGTQSSQCKEGMFIDEASNQSIDEKLKSSDKQEDVATLKTVPKITADISKGRKQRNPQKRSNKSSITEVQNESEASRITRRQSGKKPVVQHLTEESNNQANGNDRIDEPDEDQSLDGSKDLFDSQTSQSSLIDDQIDITLQLTEFIWVQCDNPDCQKWRRIPAEESEEISTDPWYCYMSSDTSRNTCSAVEEDHAMYDRMAKKAGIKFVMSMLSVGSLVWAKMAGYCRWPALVTRDPDVGCHMLIDIDGDPHSYHVEFLGKQHTHSWVAAKSVEMYGHKNVPELEEDSQSQIDDSQRKKYKKGPGRKKKVALLTNILGSKKRNSYRKMHIASVIKEADFLLALEAEERLRYTVFQFDPERKKRLEKREKRLSQTSYEKCFQCKRKGRKGKNASHEKEKISLPTFEKIENKVNEELGDHSKKIVAQSNMIKTQSKRKAGEECKVGGRKVLKKGKENASVFDYTSETASPDEGISVKSIKTEASIFDSPDQFSQSQLKFLNTMQDKSKEEKFSIDLDMYRKNEKAFEHDVQRFMSRNGQHIRNTPVWHNVPVRLFQLYLAVHERGGFEQVNKKKQWTSIYKEVTEQQHVRNGVSAKKYYEHNLYPYELYITGRSYKHVFMSRKFPVGRHRQNRKPQPEKPQLEKSQSEKHQLVKPPSLKFQSVPQEEYTSQETVLPEKEVTNEMPELFFREDGSLLSQDIEAILNQLEVDYSPKSQQKEKLKQKKSDLKFHDDKTDSQSQEVHKVPSEFHPSSTGCDVQTVPGGNFSGDGLSDIQEKILHEMKALEEDINEISDLE